MINLGCDIDDVILDTSTLILSEVKKKVGDFDIEKIRDFHIEKQVPISKKDMNKIVKDVLELPYIPPIKGAIDGLKALSLVTKPIHFISNKKTYLYDYNIRLIKNLNLDIDFILSLCTKTSLGIPNKAKIINELNINVMIEDRADTILDIIKRTSCTVIIFDKPWNRDIKNSIQTKRVNNWIEIVKFIKLFITK